MQYIVDNNEYNYYITQARRLGLGAWGLEYHMVIINQSEHGIRICIWNCDLKSKLLPLSAPNNAEN